MYTKISIILFLAMLLFLPSCEQRAQEELSSLDNIVNWSDIKARGSLRVGIVESAISFYRTENGYNGFDYNLISHFTKKHGLQLSINSYPSHEALVEQLRNQKIDLIACPITADLNHTDKYISCGHSYKSSLVCVQLDDNPITDILSLKHKNIATLNRPHYLTRLNNISKEIGYNLDVDTLHMISIEQLINGISQQEIDCTILEDHIARYIKKQNSDLNISLQVGFDQYSSWLVHAESDELAQQIENWYDEIADNSFFSDLQNKYLEQSLSGPTWQNFNPRAGQISPYDRIYQKYAKRLNWDWHFLAALSYEESRFDPMAESWAGAKGLMQLMPNTGKSFGLRDSTFTIPEENIAAGTRYIHSLQKSLAFIPVQSERDKFVLGAFHAGLGHIFDAIALAKKYGYDPQRWDNHVAVCIEMKSKKQYAEDEIIKHGIFPGKTTTSHVQNIVRRYKEFSNY